MQLSAAGLALIKHSEGFRAAIYRDSDGSATIGYGHHICPPESFPNNITEAEASAILAEDVTKAERAINRLVKVSVTQGQFDALVDFCFNLGSGRLAQSMLLRYLNQGLYSRAALELLKWDHIGKQVSPGLEARREAEYQLWNALIPSK